MKDAARTQKAPDWPSVDCMYCEDIMGKANFRSGMLTDHGMGVAGVEREVI